ncbi:MAG: hypothetical protein FWF10_00900 [Clostridiales bacterium]|nr:hypothetical protein [Clostridiales bacterium]
MLHYSTPIIEILRFKPLDILEDSSYWLGDDGGKKPPGDGTYPGWPTDSGKPSSILDIMLGN